jgi:hypothetical protein
MWNGGWKILAFVPKIDRREEDAITRDPDLRLQLNLGCFGRLSIR